MHIDPPEAPRHQALRLYEGEDLLVGSQGRLRKSSKEIEDLVPASEVPARQLPDHERMAENVPASQMRRQGRVSSTKVVHPDGRVHEH